MLLALPSGKQLIQSENPKQKFPDYKYDPDRSLKEKFEKLD